MAQELDLPDKYLKIIIINVFKKWENVVFVNKQIKEKMKL